MAKGNWWKFGLCGFAGLGVGYLVGVKVTRDRAEKEKEQEIQDIRDIYRNGRKSEKKTPAKPTIEAPEVQTKTSIDIQKLSEKKDQAVKAIQRYSAEPRVTVDKDAEPPTKEQEEEPADDWQNYIHLIDDIPQEIPDDKIQTLVYYRDGVLAYSDGRRVDDNAIDSMIGEENLRRLDLEDDCIQIHIKNDLYDLYYSVLYSYDEWAKITDEEPYKKTL